LQSILVQFCTGKEIPSKKEKASLSGGIMRKEHREETPLPEKNGFIGGGITF
jgi:hypothetical protein